MKAESPVAVSGKAWEDGASMCPFCFDLIHVEEDFMLITIDAPVDHYSGKALGLAHTDCVKRHGIRSGGPLT